ncbi:MAG: FAD-dependent oxidoreductase [Anaerococcus obesiensis]
MYKNCCKTEGVESVALVYRRTEAYMPATQEEVNDVKEEGHKIYELVAPYSYDGKVLKCEKMELGEFDESGRRSINSTGEKLDLEFDTVIGATGARVDTSAFKENNVNLDDWGNVKTTENYETNIDNVYVIGDCRAGASTIVKAMGEAKAVCLDILAKENLENDFEKFEVKEQNKIIFEKRGRLQEKIQGKNEGYRCLKCNQICEMCTEVCPNRANVAIKVDGFNNLHQIIHLDGMCNECGNCGFYCPHAGRPYKDKLTVFWTKEDFDDSTNTGFLKDGNKYLVRLENGKVIETENLDDLSENMQKLIKAI